MKKILITIMIMSMSCVALAALPGMETYIPAGLTIPDDLWKMECNNGGMIFAGADYEDFTLAGYQNYFGEVGDGTVDTSRYQAFGSTMVGEAAPWTGQDTSVMLTMGQELSPVNRYGAWLTRGFISEIVFNVKEHNGGGNNQVQLMKNHGPGPTGVQGPQSSVSAQLEPDGKVYLFYWSNSTYWTQGPEIQLDTWYSLKGRRCAIDPEDPETLESMTYSLNGEVFWYDTAQSGITSNFYDLVPPNGWIGTIFGPRTDVDAVLLVDQFGWYIPEPTTMLLFGAALLALRKRK